MTVPARGERAVGGNAGVYSGEHGQRRLYLWCAAAGAWRRQFHAALADGGGGTGVARLVCFFILSRSGARDSRGAWGGGVSRGRPGGGGGGGRKRRQGGEAGEHFFGGVECAREPLAGGRNDFETGIPPGKILGGDAGTGFARERAECLYTHDGCRRNRIQADCGTDRAASGLVEKGRRTSGSRRAHWAGAIRVACRLVGSKRSRDSGEGG